MLDATRWTDGNALTVDEMARKMWEPDPADAAGGGGAMVLAGAPANVRLCQIGNRNLDLNTNNIFLKTVLTDCYYQSWFCKYILARWKIFGFLERWLPVL